MRSIKERKEADEKQEEWRKKKSLDVFVYTCVCMPSKIEGEEKCDCTRKVCSQEADFVKILI